MLPVYNGEVPGAADQCTPLLAQATTIESLHTIPLLDHRPVLQNPQQKPLHFSSETIWGSSWSKQTDRLSNISLRDASASKKIGWSPKVWW